MTTLAVKRAAVEAEWDKKLDDEKEWPRLTMDAGMTKREKLQAVKAAWEPLHDGSVLIQDEEEEDEEKEDFAPVEATGSLVKINKTTTGSSPTTPFLAIAVAVIAIFWFFWRWN